MTEKDDDREATRWLPAGREKNSRIVYVCADAGVVEHGGRQKNACVQAWNREMNICIRG